MFSNRLIEVFDILESYLREVSNEVRTEIIKSVQEVYKDCKSKDIKVLRYEHEDDDYLYRVVVCRDNIKSDEKYVVWTYNSSLDELCLGHYDCTDKDIVNFLSAKYCGLKGIKH